MLFIIYFQNWSLLWWYSCRTKLGGNYQPFKAKRKFKALCWWYIVASKSVFRCFAWYSTICGIPLELRRRRLGISYKQSNSSTLAFTVSFSSLFFPFFLNHNYSKILKSDWPSTVLISPLIGQYALCLLVGQHAPLQSCTQMLFFSHC